MVRRVQVGPRPRSIGFLPDGSRAYVSLENDGAIAVVDAQQHKLLQRIQLEGKGNTPKPRPMGIAVHPDGSTVYVTAGSFGHLFLVDPAKNTTMMSFEVGQRPWGIALSPGWQARLYRERTVERRLGDRCRDTTGAEEDRGRAAAVGDRGARTLSRVS